MTLAERAAELSHRRDPVILDSLGAAYAEAGRFPDAIGATQQALALAPHSNDPGMVAALRSRLALYQAGRPHRETR